MNDAITKILFTGVGGQGTILMTKILSAVLADMGFDVKMSEIHGMSQRGGTVNTQLKFGKKVYAPNIGRGEADIVVAFEKAEALRALPYLKKGGKILMDDCEIYPMPVLIGAADYPHDAAEALRKTANAVTVVPALAIAKQLGSARSQNMVLLGALASLLELTQRDWEAYISRSVPPKTVAINLLAFKKGNEDI